MSFCQRNWVFTINNPDGTAKSPETWEDVKYVVWQKEKGQNGTEHWQGYVQMKKKVALSFLKKLCPTAHWEVRRGSHTQAKAYAMKADTRVDGPWEIGVDQGGDSGQNGLSGVKRMIDECASMKDIAQEYPSEVIRYGRGIRELRVLMGQHQRAWMTKTFVIWGPSGNGKTSLVERCAPGAYWVSKPKPNCGVFFDAYDGQEDVVLDEFYGWLPHDLLCRMLDRSPLLVDTKGGMVSFCPRRVWITSNKDPLNWYRHGLGALRRRLEPPNGHIARFELEVMMTEEEMRQRVDPEVACLMDKYPSWQERERAYAEGMNELLELMKGPRVCEEHSAHSEAEIELAKEMNLEKEMDTCVKVNDFFEVSDRIVKNNQRKNYDTDEGEKRMMTRKALMDAYFDCEAQGSTDTD